MVKFLNTNNNNNNIQRLESREERQREKPAKEKLLKDIEKVGNHENYHVDKHHHRHKNHHLNHHQHDCDLHQLQVKKRLELDWYKRELLRW